MELQMYVPVTSTGIDPGSAVVGSLVDGRVLVDFESDRFGAHRSETPDVRFVYNLARAADRHVSRYPTVARLSLDPSAVVQVGWFDTDTGLVAVDDHELLERWVSSVGADVSGIVAAAQGSFAARQQRDLLARASRGDVRAWQQLQLP